MELGYTVRETESKMRVSITAISRGLEKGKIINMPEMFILKILRHLHDNNEQSLMRETDTARFTAASNSPAHILRDCVNGYLISDASGVSKSMHHSD